MRKYLITFSRTILDGAGRDRRIVQRQIMVQTRSEMAAVWKAKTLFCKAAGIADWRLRADTCEITKISDLAA